MKVLIDTNVIVDALTSREPWKESAEKIFLMTANQVMEAYITASSGNYFRYENMLTFCLNLHIITS